MNEREAFLNEIASRPWDDELPRLVYADWLDEHGEYEEADRQRQYVPAVRWLRALATKHFGSEYDVEVAKELNVDLNYTGEDDTLFSYGQLMYFLKRHVDRKYFLHFETPYGFDEYSDELWQHFEIVTGLKSPQDKNRHKMPPFRCAC